MASGEVQSRDSRPGARSDPGVPDADGPAHPDHPEHHVLIDRAEDRWEWRRRIRADPTRLRLYRVAVAVAGALLIILGGLTGPLPGPGGIPLVLLGIAVWASEFAWAHRLMQWLRGQLQVLRSWSRGRQLIGWLVVGAALALFGYAYLLIIGIPGWLPTAPTRWLALLPGV